MAENPEVSDDERALFPEIDPADYHEVHFSYLDEKGRQATFQLLRSASWVFNAGAEVGSEVWLEMPEMGVSGPVMVEGVHPCPEIEGGDGQVITGLFQRWSDDVVDLSIEGLDEPLGVTLAHPFWSVDRQAFVAVADLEVGEQVEAVTGLTRVTSIVPRAGPERVYNMEVHGEHVYRVGQAGVLVHNSYAYRVGLHSSHKNLPGNLTSHHVGQRRAMERLVKNYDGENAPAIVVPYVGHIKRGPNTGPVLARAHKKFKNPREVVARDIRELRRVYPGIPNAKLKEIIDLNKKMYPEFRK